MKRHPLLQSLCGLLILMAACDRTPDPYSRLPKNAVAVASIGAPSFAGIRLSRFMDFDTQFIGELLFPGLSLDISDAERVDFFLLAPERYDSERNKYGAVVSFAEDKAGDTGHVASISQNESVLYKGILYSWFDDISLATYSAEPLVYLANNKAAMNALLDVITGGEDLTSNEDLYPLVRKNANKPFAAAISLSQFRLSDELNPFPQIRYATLLAEFRPQLHIRFESDLGSEGLARGFSAMVEGMFKLMYGSLQIAVSAPDQFMRELNYLPFDAISAAKAAVAILEPMAIKTSGTVMTLEMDVSIQKIEELYRQFGSIWGQ
jgi:hypothetical protein